MTVTIYPTPIITCKRTPPFRLQHQHDDDTLEKTCKSIDLKEELLIDLDAEIKETKLTVGTLSQIK